jgi:hypothetical protein
MEDVQPMPGGSLEGRKNGEPKNKSNKSQFVIFFH